MPRRDGTGPLNMRFITKINGSGIETRMLKEGNFRDYGFCLGLARRRGFRNRCAVNETTSKIKKELLLEEKTALKNRLDVIDGELKSL